MCRIQIRKEKFDTAEVPLFLHETVGGILMRIQGPKRFFWNLIIYSLIPDIYSRLLPREILFVQLWRFSSRQKNLRESNLDSDWSRHCQWGASQIFFVSMRPERERGVIVKYIYLQSFLWGSLYSNLILRRWPSSVTNFKLKTPFTLMPGFPSVRCASFTLAMTDIVSCFEYIFYFFPYFFNDFAV